MAPYFDVELVIWGNNLIQCRKEPRATPGGGSRPVADEYRAAV